MATPPPAPLRLMPSFKPPAECDPGPVDLVVPVKPLHAAKTRLRGATGNDDADAHSALALALAHDTITAVRAARMVRRLLVVSADPSVAAELAAIGVEVVPDPGGGLNAALHHGAALLRARDPAAPVGALQADLPALRPDELDAAVAAAAGTERAFCADAEGTGTTFLLAAGGIDLAPRFGTDSASAHGAFGALPLVGRWPGLRRDVDTPDDLRVAAELGLGSRTRAVLALAGRH